VRVTRHSARAIEFRERGFVTVKGLLPRPEVEAYVLGRRIRPGTRAA
jgi:hypothetical protein